MVVVDIAAIRAQLKKNIAETLSTFHAYDFERKTKNYPCFTVSWPDTFDPRATQAGDIDLVIPVLFEVVWLGDESSDSALMAAMEAAVDAIESDRTLTRNVDDLSCGPFTNIGSRTMPDERVVMQFVVPVEILA